MKLNIFSKAVVISAIFAQVEYASAVEFEKLGNAVASALGTKSVFQGSATVDGKKVDYFYSKNAAGKPENYAFIQKELYQTGNCTHTWVMSVNAVKKTLKNIRVVEMKCNHAFPAKQPSFLDQYIGIGPANLAKLGEINNITGATGTCELTTKAVKRSITAASKIPLKM